LLEKENFMADDTLSHLKSVDLSGPIEIAPKIWWVGHYLHEDVLQCHTYLIEEGTESVLIDPGSRLTIHGTLKKIQQVIPLDHVRYFVCQHQDPDITAALPIIDDLVLHQNAVVVSHSRLNAFLKHYDINIPFSACSKNGWTLTLPHRKLQFVPTPYLHSPGAFCTFDETSGVLFSSDLFGGFSKNWQLVAKDEGYFEEIRSFHKHYMPSREILNSGLSELGKLPIRVIAPQHGSLISSRLIPHMMVHGC
jgi:flavorubredoxin